MRLFYKLFAQTDEIRVAEKSRRAKVAIPENVNFMLGMEYGMIFSIWRNKSKRACRLNKIVKDFSCLSDKKLGKFIFFGR